MSYSGTWPLAREVPTLRAKTCVRPGEEVPLRLGTQLPPWAIQGSVCVGPAQLLGPLVAAQASSFLLSRNRWVPTRGAVAG